eukprot:7378985-Prymnesium_polylepis.2
METASDLSGGVLHPPHFMMGCRYASGGGRESAPGTAGFRLAFRTAFRTSPMTTQEGLDASLRPRRLL